jgi:NifU-like protein involved in Fe-S cluster formation
VTIDEARKIAEKWAAFTRRLGDTFGDADIEAADAIDTTLAAFDAAVEWIVDDLETRRECRTVTREGVLDAIENQITPPAASPRPEADRERPPSGCTE